MTSNRPLNGIDSILIELCELGYDSFRVFMEQNDQDSQGHYSQSKRYCTPCLPLHTLFLFPMTPGIAAESITDSPSISNIGSCQSRNLAQSIHHNISLCSPRQALQDISCGHARSFQIDHGSHTGLRIPPMILHPSHFPRLNSQPIRYNWTTPHEHWHEPKRSQTGSLHLNNLVYKLLRTPTIYFQSPKLQKLGPPASHSLTYSTSFPTPSNSFLLPRPPPESNSQAPSSWIPSPFQSWK